MPHKTVLEVWNHDLDKFVTYERKVEPQAQHDPIRKIGTILFNDVDETVQGIFPVKMSWGSEADSEFLSLCWCDESLEAGRAVDPRYEAVRNLLLNLSPAQREKVHAVFGGFLNDEIKLLFSDLATTDFDWSDISEEFGIPDTKEGWNDLVKSKIGKTD